MNNSIYRSLKLSAIIYACAYAVAVYYKWDFFLPLTWIADVPTWSGDKRIALALYVVFSIAGTYLFANHKLLLAKREQRFDPTKGSTLRPSTEDVIIPAVISWMCAIGCASFISCH